MDPGRLPACLLLLASETGAGRPSRGPGRVRGQAHRRVWERRLPSEPRVAPNGPASAHSRFGTHVFTFSPLGWDRASDDHEREAGHGGGDSLQVPGPEGGIRGVTPAPRRSRALLLASSSCSPLFPLACGRLTPDSVSQLPRLFRLGASQKDARRADLGPCEIQREILVSRSFIRSAETSSSSK